MLRHLLPTLFLLSGLALPAQALDAQSASTHRTVAQAQPTADDLYQACTQNRAETLPNPFTDVPANHWAFKAVMTMHYCGAFRQAAPKQLFEQSRPTQSSVPSPQTLIQMPTSTIGPRQ